MSLLNIHRLLKPDSLTDYVEWADTHFYLSRESSSEHGKFRSSRTPFIREPLLHLSPNSDTEVVVVLKPTQCAGTTIALIFLCASADVSPGPTLFMQPTESMCKSFSKKKLSKCVEAVPKLKGKIADKKSRDSANTILQKDFPGGSWMLTGSNSSASFRQESIKYLVMDDFDDFEMDIEGEGDPKELADRRTGTFVGRKIYINSTTTLKDSSNILNAFNASSQGHFQVPCPHCDEYQYLEWGIKDDYGIQYEQDDEGQVIDAYYKCKFCGGRIDESKKQYMLEHGKYIHSYPNRPVKGYRWNALYTPIGWINSWKYIASKFVEAYKEQEMGNPEKYKTWLNSFMAEAYEDKGERLEWEVLAARCEPYKPFTPPAQAQILSAGIDVQHNRLAVSIYAWGIGEECWLIYHTEIIGDVQYDEVWNQLDGLLDRQYTKTDGQLIQITSAAVDAGDGRTTQIVRNYCRMRSPKVIAIKGASSPGKSILGTPTKQDLTWQGQKIENGVDMWPVGTDVAKNTIYSRLNITRGGPGRIHFYVGADDEYFKQLTSEKLITKFVKGFPKREWHIVRGNKRNEALDCLVYAYAAALRSGLAYLVVKPKVINPRKREVKQETQRERRRW